MPHVNNRERDNVVILNNMSQELEIGLSYEGGKIIYIFQPGDYGYVVNETRGYIIAEKAITQFTNGNWESFFDEFNCNSVNCNTYTALGKGQQNTNKIVENCGNNTATDFCDKLIINGYGDWFLPSKDELSIVYRNYKLVGGVYPIKSQGVWSSSSYDAGNAWVCSFDGSGNWFVLPKNYGFYLKPLRRF